MDWSKLIDKSKEALKKGADFTAKGVGQVADNLKHKQQVGSAKRRLMGKLTLKQLQKIVREYNLETSFAGNPFVEENYGGLTRTECEDLVGGLDVEVLIELVQRRTNASRQFIEEIRHELNQLEKEYDDRRVSRWKQEGKSEETATEEEYPELKALIDFLKTMVLPPTVTDESALQDVLYSSLCNSQRFGKIEKEYSADNQRPDFLVKDTAIEVKVPRNNKDSDAAYGQALRYKELKGVNNVVLFFYAPDDNSYNAVDSYKGRISEESGIYTIIRSGGLRKTKVKWRYPNITVQYPMDKEA